MRFLVLLGLALVVGTSGCVCTRQAIDTVGHSSSKEMGPAGDVAKGVALVAVVPFTLVVDAVVFPLDVVSVLGTGGHGRPVLEKH